LIGIVPVIFFVVCQPFVKKQKPARLDAYPESLLRLMPDFAAIWVDKLFAAVSMFFSNSRFLATGSIGVGPELKSSFSTDER